MSRKHAGRKRKDSRGLMPFIVLIVAGVLLVASVYFFTTPSDNKGDEPGEIIEPAGGSGRIIAQYDRFTVSEAELIPFENSPQLSFLRGDNFLTVDYVQTKISFLKKNGPGFIRITPEEIPPGGTVSLYTRFVDGNEVVTTVLQEYLSQNRRYFFRFL